ncbi:MAG: NTP transferase domain-containing protein [Candidatus Latescibacteria bacterium]|jgi:CDP-L-myo-inositol myo-inositolphosphotransferase|nr:NTP transferase domain-containing protein [Candidatus Latescibacterota bacterium]
MVNKAVIIAAGMGSRLRGYGVDLPKPLVPVAGVPLLKRTILSAFRAGISEFVVVTGYRGDEIQGALASDSQLADLTIDWVQNKEWERGNGVSVLSARDYVDEPFILLMSDHLFDPEALVKLRHTPVGQDEAVLCVDSRLDEIFDMEDATKVLRNGDRVVKIGKELADFNAVDTGIFLCSPFLFKALEQSIATGEGSLSGGIRILSERGSMRTADIGDAFWLDVDTPEAHVHAEGEMFRRLGKPTDGFVSRNVNRKVSTRISRLLVRTPVTPNQLSIATMFLSFLSAWLVFKGGESYLHLALGGLLFQFASIVDGCDGEIAKLKFMGSRLGEWIDTIADNVSYLVFFWAVLAGMYVYTEDTFYPMLGGVMVFLDVLGVLLIFLYMKLVGSGSIVSFNMAFSSDVPEDERGWFHRLCMSLKFVSRRDFFAAFFCTLALVNSIAGMYWFLVIGSVFLTAGIFGFGGQMLRTHGAWAGSTGNVSDEKLGEKAD